MFASSLAVTSAQNLRGQNVPIEPEQLVNINHNDEGSNFDRELTNAVNLGRFKNNCVGVHPTQSANCQQRCIYPRFRTQMECSTCDCYDLPEDYDEDDVAPKSTPNNGNTWTASSTSRTTPTTNTASTNSNNNGTAGNSGTPVSANTNPQQPPRVSINFRPPCVGPAPGDQGCRSVCGLGKFYKEDYCAACDRNCFN